MKASVKISTRFQLELEGFTFSSPESISHIVMFPLTLTEDLASSQEVARPNPAKVFSTTKSK